MTVWASEREIQRFAASIQTAGFFQRAKALTSRSHAFIQNAAWAERSLNAQRGGCE